MTEPVPASPGDTVDGGKARNYFSSRTSTKASHIEYSQEDFDKNGVDFKVKIMGSMEVDAAQGEKLCANALADIKMKLKSVAGHKQQVIFKIGDKGITIIDDKTGEKILQHNANKISYLTPDRQDNRVFGLIYFMDKKHFFFAYKCERNIPASAILNCVKDFFEHLVAKRKILKEQAAAKKKAENQPDPATQTKLIESKEIKSPNAEEIKKQEILNLAGITNNNEIKKASEENVNFSPASQPAEVPKEPENAPTNWTQPSANTANVGISKLQPPPPSSKASSQKTNLPMAAAMNGQAKNDPFSTATAASSDQNQASLDSIFSPQSANQNQAAPAQPQPALNQPTQGSLDPFSAPLNNQSNPQNNQLGQQQAPPSQTSFDDIFSPKPSSQGNVEVAKSQPSYASLDNIFSPQPSGQDQAQPISSNQTLQGQNTTSQANMDNIFSPQPSSQISTNNQSAQPPAVNSQISLDDIFSPQASVQVSTNNQPAQPPVVHNQISLDDIFSSQSSQQASVEVTNNQASGSVNTQISFDDILSQPAGNGNTASTTSQFFQGQHINKQVSLDDIFSSAPSTQSNAPSANQPFMTSQTSVPSASNPFSSQITSQVNLEISGKQDQSSLMAQNLFSGSSTSQTNSPSPDGLLTPSPGFSNPFFGTNSRVNSRSNSPITTTQRPFESDGIQSHGNDSNSINPFITDSSSQVNYNAGHGLFLSTETKPESPAQNAASPFRQNQMDKAFADLNILGPKETKPQKSLPMSAMANQKNFASSANNTFQPIDTASPFDQEIPLQKPSAFSPASGNNSNNDPFGAPSATVTVSTTTSQQVPSQTDPFGSLLD